jgi:hypothetical protein
MKKLFFWISVVLWGLGVAGSEIFFRFSCSGSVFRRSLVDLVSGLGLHHPRFHRALF